MTDIKKKIKKRLQVLEADIITIKKYWFDAFLQDVFQMIVIVLIVLMGCIYFETPGKLRLVGEA